VIPKVTFQQVETKKNLFSGRILSQSFNTRNFRGEQKSKTVAGHFLLNGLAPKKQFLGENPPSQWKFIAL
jgi:hypothetical protein